jgi:hypothetical protein
LVWGCWVYLVVWYGFIGLYLVVWYGVIGVGYGIMVCCVTHRASEGKKENAMVVIAPAVVAHLNVEDLGFRCLGFRVWCGTLRSLLIAITWRSMPEPKIRSCKP